MAWSWRERTFWLRRRLPLNRLFGAWVYGCSSGLVLHSYGFHGLTYSCWAQDRIWSKGVWSALCDEMGQPGIGQVAVTWRTSSGKSSSALSKSENAAEATVQQSDRDWQCNRSYAVVGAGTRTSCGTGP
jgi:hypothetical protein